MKQIKHISSVQEEMVCHISSEPELPPIVFVCLLIAVCIKVHWFNQTMIIWQDTDVDDDDYNGEDYDDYAGDNGKDYKE